MFASTLFPAVLAMVIAPAVVRPHVVMNLPRPYHHDTELYLDTGPLDAVVPYKHVFPCHGFLDPDPGHHPTAVNAGEQLLVNFTIGAEHHGGSCQFSVLYGDDDPEVHANWKVIYSIIGGCPANSTLPLNVGFDTDPNIKLTQSLDAQKRVGTPVCTEPLGNNCARQFNIPVPKDMPNGRARFAWTWFNWVGNREMYMNCAPIEIHGGADDRSFHDSLPSMFVANFEGAPCWTGPNPKIDPGESNQGILNFPEPGNLGTVLEQPHFSIFTGPGYNCPVNTIIPAFEVVDSSSTTAGVPSVSTSAARTSSADTSATAGPPGVFPTVSPTDNTTIIPSLSFTMPTPSLTTFKTNPTSPSTSRPSPVTPVTPTRLSASYPQGDAGPPRPRPACPFPNSFPCSKPNGALACRNASVMGLCVNSCAQAISVAAGMQCVTTGGTEPDVYKSVATQCSMKMAMSCQSNA